MSENTSQPTDGGFETGNDAWMQLLAGFARGILDQMRTARFSILILDTKEDATLGIQLGIAILLDKPILVICGDGAAVSNKLRQVADEIVDVPMLDKSQWEAGRPQVEAAIKRMLVKLDKAAKWDAATRKQNWREQ